MITHTQRAPARRLLLFLLAWLALAAQAAAHDGLHEQIEAVTAQIRREPKNASLYLKRGELYRLHRRWGLALRDYTRAEDLDPALALVDLARGRMWFEAGRARQSLPWLKRFLSKQPSHSEAFGLRARALAKLGRSAAAAQDFTRAIELSPDPQPDIYIERARALAATGQLSRALGGLDEGIGRLGPVVTLQLYAIELEVGRRHYDAALSRLDSISAQSPRQEVWLARRGDILRSAGRIAEARAAYSAALAALDSLPPWRRQTKAALELEAHLRTALSRAGPQPLLPYSILRAGPP